MSFVAGHFKIPRMLLNPEKNSVSFDHKTTVAWQVNHMCAVFDALAAAFMFCSVSTINSIDKTVVSNSVIGVTGVMLFAFSPLVWEYSTTAEVFALNNLLCAMLIYLTCRLFVSVRRWKESSAAKASKSPTITITGLTLLGALVSGLALSNQHACLLQVAYLVPYIAGLLYFAGVPNFWALMVKAGLCFLWGLSPYAYLVVASHSPTPGTWGDMTSVSGLLRHVLRSEYGTFQLGFIRGSETALERVLIYCQYVSAESFHTAFPLAAIAVLFALSSMSSSPAAATAERISNDDKSTTSSVRPNKKQSKPKSSSLFSTPDTNTALNSSTGLVARAFGTDGNQLPLALLGLWLFYTAVWNCVLSNLPLSAPMPFAVHSRFWMQPNIVLYILVSVGSDQLWSCFVRRLNLGTSASYSAAISSVFQTAVVVAVVAVVFSSRFESQDRSRSGTVIHKYAELALTSLPERALLLSHTDLDWNPARYLQHCEALRRDVTQLSFQLMPYPWFGPRQAALYPNVTFPDTTFKGVSTERSSEGNAALIMRFLQANEVHSHSLGGDPIGTKFPGGLFLDMQAVNEAEIEAMGAWRGLTLVPWGTLYRVHGGGKPSLSALQQSHHSSVAQLRRLVAGFPVVDKRFIAQFPAGTWEFAAASVFYDAHYQLGLSLLTFAMELQREAKVELLPVLLDRLLCASSLLTTAARAALAFETISSSVKDLHKNTALSWMRLHSLIGVISQHEQAVVQNLNRQHREQKVSKT